MSTPAPDASRTTKDAMTDQPSPPDPAARVIALEQELAAMRVRSDSRLLQSELKAEAIRAGIIDLDGLKLLDTAALRLNEDGSVPDAPAALARLKRDKPWLFTNPNSSHPAAAPAPEPPKLKTAMEMTLKEWRLAREKLIKGR